MDALISLREAQILVLHVNIMQISYANTGGKYGRVILLHKLLNSSNGLDRKIGVAQGKHPELHENISEKEASSDNDPCVN